METSTQRLQGGGSLIQHVPPAIREIRRDRVWVKVFRVRMLGVRVRAQPT